MRQRGLRAQDSARRPAPGAGGEVEARGEPHSGGHSRAGRAALAAISPPSRVHDVLVVDLTDVDHVLWLASALKATHGRTATEVADNRSCHIECCPVSAQSASPTTTIPVAVPRI